MLLNYFRIALRNILRSKTYSFITISGLAIGLASCILIFLYIQFELSYDKHWPDSDKIYRVNVRVNLQGQVDSFAMTGFGVGPALKAEYPGIREQLRVLPQGKVTFGYADKIFKVDNCYFADSNYFSFFQPQIKYGSFKDALTEPKSVVINEEVAALFFGNVNPVGKYLLLRNSSYKVTAVFNKGLQASHLNPNLLISLASIPPDRIEEFNSDWLHITSYTYLKFNDKHTANAFQPKLNSWVRNVVDTWLKSNGLNASCHFSLQSLPDIHFNVASQFDVPGNKNKVYIYIFGCVAVFLLLIASINYMNLATARSSKRAKEVGIRKVVGASVNQIRGQFLGESLFIAFISLIFAFVLVELLLPVFNHLTDNSFSLFGGNLLSWNFITVIFFLVVFIGVVGGSYPSFILSRFNAVQVIKGNLISNGRNWMLLLRKIMVIIQFSISIILIVATVVVFSQMKYMKSRDLGYNKEQVLVLEVPRDSLSNSKVQALQAEIKKDHNVLKISASNDLPGNGNGRLLFSVEQDNKMGDKAMNYYMVDEEFANILEMNVVKGRFFSKQYSTDASSGVVINESAAAFMGYKAGEALGKKIENDFVKGKIIGVVRDFNYTSLHSKVEPLVMMLNQGSAKYLLVKVSATDLAGTINKIGQAWKSFKIMNPFEYYFLDDRFDEQYSKEEKMLQVFGYFSLLTIFISCLGLFGLASFTAEQRTKEIGIRKVLGASIVSIIRLLSADFIKLVLISMLIAFPLAFFASKRWLADFAYRISPGISIFLFAAFVALAIAILTVASRGYKAAVANPVDSIKYE